MIFKYISLALLFLLALNAQVDGGWKIVWRFNDINGSPFSETVVAGNEEGTIYTQAGTSYATTPETEYWYLASSSDRINSIDSIYLEVERFTDVAVLESVFTSPVPSFTAPSEVRWSQVFPPGPCNTEFPPGPCIWFRGLDRLSGQILYVQFGMIRNTIDQINFFLVSNTRPSFIIPTGEFVKVSSGPTLGTFFSAKSL